MSQRRVAKVVTAHRQLEGGGFSVRRPFPTQGLDMVDPFLMLDEMGPVEYAPGKAVGAPDHPHRGFETVTYVLKGDVVHEDSHGGGGTIGPGDVQWMTAGSGIVHSEMPSETLQREGGWMHGFQIWVNLPASKKMSAPRYQGLSRDEIPSATSEDGLATVRVIAGSALGVDAAIDTHIPITYQHWSLKGGASLDQPVPTDHNAFAYVFDGTAEVGESRRLVTSGQVAFFGPGDVVRIGAAEGSTAEVLLLSGKPIREPVARYGPFVMNTRDEIIQAFEDYQTGKMGNIERS